MNYNIYIYTAWWFQTCFYFPYIRDTYNPSHWRTPFFDAISVPRPAEELALSTWCHMEFVDLMACSKVRRLRRLGDVGHIL